MREAVICNPLRTPVGRYGGVFRDIDVTTLAATVIEALLERTGLDPASIDDVVFGQCYPSGEAPAVGRVAALHAGLPVETPGLQLDRRCGSGLQAICYAAMQVQTGVSDVVLAGGAESMSTVEFYSSAPRWGPNNGAIELHDRLARARVTAGSFRHPVPGGMIETAENERREYGIPREEQDALALRSHQRAVAAQDEGRFEAEIVPVAVPQRRGDPVIVDTDEHPRRDTSLESLARLRAVYGADDPESTVTAGNASGQNDAAAVCIVTTPERAADLGLKAMGKLRGWSVAGVAPKLMGLGPVPAAKKAFDQVGMDFGDMDLIELNEAFAAQVLGVTREWGLSDSDWDRVNVNGSGISIGHPVGATGVRIMATLLHEMERNDAEIGLETMCIGGGQGMAAVVERC
ncbi:MAG: acetyl-CoA C-acetyltransferase [Chloroflexi bacterium]|nr:acetyl-CoA C-acetyltransferase [Chloroflexota bacterium]